MRVQVRLSDDGLRCLALPSAKVAVTFLADGVVYALTVRVWPSWHEAGLTEPRSEYISTSKGFFTEKNCLLFLSRTHAW